MASSSDNISMAVFCDFENVALGVRDANYEKFDIKPVLERLLLKGSIVVKKAYCDWDRYKGFKSTMHEANFELIEIPHVRQSGKNSADIRLVVDALDLCYTKSHVNTFVIISGDSDFSPLVSKLRENAKQVIGVGVKQSTSDLLVANCDEFIFYDDLVREQRRAAAKRDERKAQPQTKRPSDDRRKEELEARKVQALEMVVETFDALVSERGDTGKIWASLLKDTLKRRRPDFSETYYGFRTFGNLLEEAQTRGLFEFGRDEKSGTYVYRSAGAPALLPVSEQAAEPVSALIPEALMPEVQEPAEAPAATEEAEREPRRRGRGGRKQGGRAEAAAAPSAPELGQPDADEPVALESAPPAPAEPEPAPEAAPAEEVAAPAKERRRAPRKTAARKSAATPAEEAAPAEAPEAAPEPAPEPAAEAAAGDVEAGETEDAKAARKKPARPAHKAPARKPAARGRRPAKPKAGGENG
ncbi:NYN domain protein [Massilia sp. KIM]|uniref:NYN domain-containing protein n=1 Tax=Massilia sp. KIM TaxID=1955422 RepID=UPI00098FC10C|nr:NYN domain-containing protein [Massilia sp. KIM]OON62170.1 NYN domain protein [Massilia sp. KIM]